MSIYYSPAGANSSTGATSASTAPVVNDQTLVYHVNFLFIAMLALFALARLPRAIALFGTTNEWLNGHFLRHVHFSPAQRRYLAHNSGYPPASSKEGNQWSSDDSHTPYSHAQRVNEKGAPIAMRFPPHIAACIKPLRPLLTPLRSRIAPGFSVAQFMILAVYFYSLVYAGFYRSNIFTQATRTGWVAISQLPFVFALAQKNSVLGFLLGYGYEKLNFLHRFAGRLVVVASNLHGIHYFYLWSLNGTFSTQIKTPASLWGFVALLCVDLIFFFSTEYWRQKAYRLFLSTHIFGFILVLPALYLHKPEMINYVLACVILFALDHVLRIVKSRLTTAHIRPLPELEMTRVEIPSINAGWRAGQHIRLRVLSGALGWTGWAETHPFTIASVSKGQEGMVLMCKKAGPWTRKLYEVAKMGGYTEGGVGREMKVVVEGPYGGPKHAIFSSFSAAVFVAGGSGITFALAVIQDLVQKDLAGESKVKTIELVWIVPDPASLAPLLPLLSSLVQQSVFTPLRISVFYTRAPTGKQPAFFASSSAGPFIGSSPLAAPMYTAPTKPAGSPPIPKRPPPLNLQDTPEGDLYRSRSGKGTAPLNVNTNMKRSGSGASPSTPAPTRGDVKRSGSGPKSAGPSNAHEPPASAAALLSANSNPSESHFPRGLTLAPGKPRLLKFIEQALQRAVTLGHGHSYSRMKDEESRLSGLVVGVCGPVGLADDVMAAVAGVDPVRRDQVGGVEVHEEVFGW